MTNIQEFGLNIHMEFQSGLISFMVITNYT